MSHIARSFAYMFFGFVFFVLWLLITGRVGNQDFTNEEHPNSPRFQAFSFGFLTIFGLALWLFWRFPL